MANINVKNVYATSNSWEILADSMIILSLRPHILKNNGSNSY